MNIDVKPVLSDILAYLKESSGEGWEDVKEQALEYLDESETRLLKVALETTTGDLSPEFLAERAKDEVSILESQAISLGIISTGISQEIANTTVQKLLTTVIQTLINLLDAKNK